MRVPDEIKKCVCFVCAKLPSGEFQIGGTAFFVSMSSEVTDTIVHAYVVTAKHCIKQVEDLGSNVYLRMNRALPEEGAVFVEIAEEWHCPDGPADVAVLPVAIPDIFDFRVLPYRMFATKELIEKEDIGIGEDLLIAGLFTMRHGTQRNCPIVREGILAAMPDEPLEDPVTGEKYDAYLAEVRSIGGLSGSPVFSVLHMGRARQGAFISAGPTVYLLGLIRGHWDLKTKSTLLTFAEDDLAQVNMGIAVVTPITEAEKILFSDELVKIRRQTDNEWRKNNAPTLD